MKVFLIVLAALFLVGQIRVGGLAEYSAEGFRAWVRAGALKIRVFPLNKKDKPARKKEKRAKPPKKKEEAPPPPKPLAEKAGGALDYARALLPVALDAVGTMYGKLRMDTLELELTVGAADPADAAMRYGQASAALGALWEPLTRAFHVKDGRARVRVDFEAGEMTVYGLASLSIKIGQILWLSVYFGCKALRGFLAVRGRQKQKQQQRKAA
ncbi:MAG: DUF2953 domain-containing protein [Lawsonibacter sp.]|nr:DUF2953 domain-containing protein [Lawsonibacter sp.]